jgi:hypothetical protein
MSVDRILEPPYRNAIDDNGEPIKVKLDKETGEYVKQNAPFKQFLEGAAYDLLLITLREHPLAGNLFMFFIKHMNTTNKILISYDAMVAEFKFTRATIGKAIKHLIDKDMLTILKSGNSNIYCLNDKIVWRDSMENKKYSSFSCDVYVTKDEQVKKDHVTKIVPKSKKK